MPSSSATMTPPAVDWTELIRANIRSLQPYRCARDDYSEGILLDANENALGHSILNEADLEELHLNRCGLPARVMACTHATVTQLPRPRPDRDQATTGEAARVQGRRTRRLSGRGIRRMPRPLDAHHLRASEGHDHEQVGPTLARVTHFRTKSVHRRMACTRSAPSSTTSESSKCRWIASRALSSRKSTKCVRSMSTVPPFTVALCRSWRSSQA
jgi:hypothetical protein